MCVNTEAAKMKSNAASGYGKTKVAASCRPPGVVRAIANVRMAETASGEGWRDAPLAPPGTGADDVEALVPPRRRQVSGQRDGDPAHAAADVEDCLVGAERHQFAEMAQKA